MLPLRLFALLLGPALADEACPSDDVSAPSLLAKRSHVVRDVLSTSEDVQGMNGTCTELSLPGFKLEGCEQLSPGQSCLAKCPEGKVGMPVRYFCFKGLIGMPPAGLAPPFCRDASSKSFPHDKIMALEWEGKGCLKCEKAWKSCEVLEGAKPGDSGCTEFKVDQEDGLLRTSRWATQCFDIRGGPKPGLWGCNKDSANQRFQEEDSMTYPGSRALCVKSGRGKMCFNVLGLPVPFFDKKPDKVLLQTALAALKRGDNMTFLQQSYAQQVCRARLESGVPDSFWKWMRRQPFSTVQALFSTYPVHPGQVRMFHAIREAVGHDEFQKLNMASFAVALSYVNRMKGSIDDAIQMPHPSFEINEAGYLAEDREKIKQEMKDGKHCRIQSNECRDLHKCCGTPDTWKFTWPRDPSPSVRDWVQFWVKKTAQHGAGLWMNPLNEVPWPFATYIWPSPVEECEWIHSKLIENKAMEGKWYLYDSSFHNRICQGGAYHPDSLPGIAVYGGVCGRMAQLEWRKTSCMGKPATQKGEPGHCAGFRFGATTGRYSTFNVITDVSDLSTVQVIPEVFDYVNLEVVKGDAAFAAETTECLKCKSWKKCKTAPAGDAKCTKFTIDKDSKLFKTEGNQCLDMFSGPKPGLWSCSATSDNQVFTEGSEGYFIKSGRGQLKVRTTDVPKEIHVPKCLKCKSWKACTYEAPGSDECSKFYYDAEKMILKPLGSSQCLDMRSGGHPGLWTCSNSDNQKAAINADGNPVIQSSRGRLEFKRVAIKADESEKGRCIVCKLPRSACTFAVAGDKECTEFIFEPEKNRINFNKWGQCLEMASGPRPALYNCNGGDHQKVSLDDKGRIEFSSNRGRMHLHVPLGEKLPETTTRWGYEGFHEISCTKANCHYYSTLGLDSKNLFDRRHKESALALFEAFNGYEKRGIFPTAHDEARLAASMVYSLKQQDVFPLADLEPVLSWALQRNPANYEAWELAAGFGSGVLTGAPSRDDLASHDWYKQLALLSLEGTSDAERAAADSFARKHLLNGQKWLQLPQLRKALIGKICGALSEGLLQELGEASEQCVLLRRLAQGEGWEDARDTMLDEDALCTGNKPSDAFQTHWEVIARVAVTEGNHGQKEKLEKLVEYLLERLSVGYINERSETSFTENGRVLLSSPFAHVLQVSAVVLPKEAREKVLTAAKSILEKPFENSEKLRASPEELMDPFLSWVSGDRKPTRNVTEESSAADSVNGGRNGDNPNPEVLKEMQLDRDAEMELGATFWHEKEGNDDEDTRYEAEHLLKRLLSLRDAGASSPQSSASDGGLANKATSLEQAVVEEHQKGTTTNTELMQYCMDDLLAS